MLYSLSHHATLSYSKGACMAHETRLYQRVSWQVTNTERNDSCVCCSIVSHFVWQIVHCLAYYAACTRGLLPRLLGDFTTFKVDTRNLHHAWCTPWHYNTRQGAVWSSKYHMQGDVQQRKCLDADFWPLLFAPLVITASQQWYSVTIERSSKRWA